MYIYICKRMLVTKQCWYTQTSAISPSLTSLLLYPKTQGMYILYLNLPPCCHISLSYITNFDIRVIHQEFKPHACTHHVVIIVINVINAMLILCYSIMSHATLILFLSCIQINTIYLLNITCTLVATCMLLGRLDCTFDEYIVITNSIFNGQCRDEQHFLNLLVTQMSQHKEIQYHLL